jgi:hypothetical protein
MPIYFEGKNIAENAVKTNFQDKGILIKPSFIYGGNSFSLNPPRVTESYGALVERLLSSPPLRFLASVSPPIIKVALVPPISGCLSQLSKIVFSSIK